MKVDISQGVSLSTKGSKLAHWEQWVVLKKKVNIYAVFMKIRLDRIPQATNQSNENTPLMRCAPDKPHIFPEQI